MVAGARLLISAHGTWEARGRHVGGTSLSSTVTGISTTDWVLSAGCWAPRAPRVTEREGRHRALARATRKQSDTTPSHLPPSASPSLSNSPGCTSWAQVRLCPLLVLSTQVDQLWRSSAWRSRIPDRTVVTNECVGPEAVWPTASTSKRAGVQTLGGDHWD